MSAFDEKIGGWAYGDYTGGSCSSCGVKMAQHAKRAYQCYPCALEEKRIRESLLINDGGSAFPINEVRLPDGTPVQQGSFGMSIRDYFASKALVCMSNIFSIDYFQNMKKTEQEVISDWAKKSYKIADAMIKEREKEKSDE